jgi:sulfate transporter 4
MQHPNTNPTPSSLPPNIAISQWASKLRGMTWLQWLEFFLPCLRWIRIYKWREYFQVDLMAGITVGVMLVPQVTVFLRSENN